VRVLVTGGNGSVGRDLVPALLLRGNEVVVLDREVSALRAPGPHRHLDLIEGTVEDRAAVARAIHGAGAVVHLAWSFADQMQTLLERDLIVPPAEWNGAPFLADAWRLDDGLARERLGYRPRRDAAGVRAQLRDSIARTWEGLRRA
jgi:nucleoside-diphosphate-sugar epimerase